MSTADAASLQAFRETAQRFAEKELKPRALESDRYPYAEFNAGAFRAAREVGLADALLPESEGGTGQGIEVFSEILFALAREDASPAATLFVNALAQAALVRWGKPEMVKKQAGSGLLAFPVYEPPGELPPGLRAEQRGGGYALSGRAEYVALAPVAEAAVLPARVGEPGKTALFLVPLAAPGVSLGAPVLSLGLRGSPVADLEMKNVELPGANLLCPDAGAGYPALAARFRPAAAALAVGVAAGSAAAARAYAGERFQAGQLIIEHHQVRLLISNLAVQSETGQALFRAMARAVDEGKPGPLSEAGLILLSEGVSRAVSDGVQALGGYGYIEDYGQEKRMRDAKQLEGFFGPALRKRMELMNGILGEK